MGSDEQRWHSCVEVIAFCQCGPVMILAWCYMSIEFVFGCCLALSIFIQVLLISFPPERPSFANFNSTWIEDRCTCRANMAFSLKIVIYLMFTNIVSIDSADPLYSPLLPTLA